ncbi:dienelactone hydrolase family protein [Actinocorallia longicatena]|uniref:Poly(ethylene terephthalate) hydrolase n=1 Tax=Actinocorallia longicatena TaxID=111803 RepID=A0ABP6Q9G7_9ACTN
MLSATVLAAACAVVPATHATATGHERGPDPTEQSITAVTGPYAVSVKEVPAKTAPGFNKGTVYYPSSRKDGTFGGVVIIPGLLEPESTMSWFGPRLASQGFVVFTLEAFSLADFPEPRAGQLLAALDHLAATGPAAYGLDPSRLAVMGHSMGGGGALRAAQQRPSLRAAIPMAPWHTDRAWQDVRVPTMIQAGDNDFIAGAGTHALPFYDNLTAAPEKAYLLFENAGHFTWAVPGTQIAKYSIAWLKRYVDDDTRYSRFLCPPPPAPGAVLQDHRGTCPA